MVAMAAGPSFQDIVHALGERGRDLLHLSTMDRRPALTRKDICRRIRLTLSVSTCPAERANNQYVSDAICARHELPPAAAPSLWFPSTDTGEVTGGGGRSAFEGGWKKNCFPGRRETAKRGMKREAEE